MIMDLLWLGMTAQLVKFIIIEKYMNKLKFTYSTIINISTPIKKEIWYQ